ncbi:MAG: hypothetical protein FWE26_03350 [Coriobacteriia bacterium]|nr:hypothetical protein [Coriobacteriia bacterium]
MEQCEESYGITASIGVDFSVSEDGRIYIADISALSANALLEIYATSRGTSFLQDKFVALVADGEIISKGSLPFGNATLRRVTDRLASVTISEGQVKVKLQKRLPGERSTIRSRLWKKKCLTCSDGSDDSPSRIESAKEDCHLEELKQNLKELDVFVKNSRGITAEEYEKTESINNAPPQYTVKIRQGNPLRAIVSRSFEYIDYRQAEHERIMGEKVRVLQSQKNMRLCEVEERTGGDYVIYGLTHFRKTLEDKIHFVSENPEQFAEKEPYPREVEDIAADLVWDGVYENPYHREPECHKRVVREYIDRLEDYYWRL